MKVSTIERTETRTVVDTKYECEECDFVAFDTDTMEHHHAEKHAVRRKAVLLHSAVRWFDSRHDAEVWLLWNSHADDRQVLWTEPGWYSLTIREVEGIDHAVLNHISSQIVVLEARIAEMTCMVEEIRTFILNEKRDSNAEVTHG